MYYTINHGPVWRLNESHFQPELLMKSGCGRLLSKVLATRFQAPEEAYRFISSHTIIPAFAISELKEAANLILRHVNSGSRILVSGDYDADGICATAIIVTWLRQMGNGAEWYLPNRADGYGFNERALEKALAMKANLIIAVDTGTNDVGTCQAARESGIDVIVVDHHEPLRGRPPAAAFVNPHYHGDKAAYYCASGLAYKLIEELSTRSLANIPPEITVMAAIGTVADVMPLIGENRYLVSKGLELWNLVDIPGIVALRELVKSSNPRASTFGYTVGPLLNAPGRLSVPDPSLELLLTDSLDKARELSRMLDEINCSRKEITERVEQRLKEKLQIGTQDRAIVAATEDSIPLGIAGIVAGHLAKQYNRPAVVLTPDEEMLRGSGRAPAGYNLVEALASLKDSLYTFGGHPQAVGLSLPPANLDALRSALNRVLPPPYPVVYDIDAVLKDADLAGLEEEVAELELLEPCGSGNPEPLFLIRGATPENARRIGSGAHMRFKLGPVWFIWFYGAEEYENCSAPLDVVFNLSINDYDHQLEVRGIVKAAATSVVLTRDDVAKAYMAASHDFKLVPDDFQTFAAPALAVLQELGLINYDVSSGIWQVISPDEKKDLRSSRIFLAYAS